MYLGADQVEALRFDFKFCMPNSTNSWEQTIFADEGNVLPAEMLSGNLICVNEFRSYDKIIHKSSYRIFYD